MISFTSKFLNLKSMLGIFTSIKHYQYWEKYHSTQLPGLQFDKFSVGLAKTN